MCLKNQIQQTLAEIVEKQERLAKLQSLEQKTNPTMQALYDLLEMYREVSPSDIPDLIAEITTTCHNYQKSIAPQIDSVEELTDTQCQQQLEVWSKEAIIPELEKLNQEAQVKTDSMPALTLWQPWATLIAEEVKRIETRSWSTNYRGPIAIHAAKRSIYTGSPELLDLLQEDSEPPLGAVVAIANLLDCVEMTPEFIAQQSDQELKCGDWQPGRFAWILEIIRPVVPPIPATGGQKLWNWSGTSIAAELEYLENKTELLGLVQFSHQVLAERQAKPEYATPTAEPEYEPDQAYDTVESILKSNGFFQPDDLEDYDSDEKYETYRGWDVYYSFPNGGVVSIGLYNAEYNQPWDVSTEYIQEIDNTFPESLADYDAIVKWTRTLIDKVENLEAPDQLALKFPDPIAEPAEEKTTNWYLRFHEKRWEVTVINRKNGSISFLFQTGEEGFTENATPEEVQKYNGSAEACADMLLARRFAKVTDESESKPKPTQLQKLLAGNSNFTFEDLGVSVVVESVFTEEEETEEENEEDSGEPDIVEVEEVRFTVSNAEGKTKEYYHDAELLVRGSQRLATIVKFNAEQYAKEFLQDLEKDEEIKEKIARWNADETLQSNQKLSQSAEPEPTKETKVETVQPEATIDNFLDFPINTMGVQVQVYPQYAGENNLMGVTFRFLSLEEKSADRKPKVVYSTSLLAVELGDRSYKLAAIDLLQNWQAKETARLEKLANPYAKEEDKFVEMVKISNDVGYLKEKATGKILAGYAAFSNKKTDGSRTGHAKKRAQKWADLLKGSFQIECQPPRIPKRMVSDNVQQSFAYEVKIVNPSIGQLIKLAEEDLSLLPLEREEKQAPSELAHSELPHDNRNGETIATEKVTDKKSLTDNEVKIVELIRAALSKFNAEAVQEINSAEVSELVRNKVWELLTEEEQKVYELLLKMEFAQAPDFSVKTPEFITRVDGKQGKSVFLSLRAIDGVSSRVWRYQGQTGEGGYPCKEAATVAAWLL